MGLGGSLDDLAERRDGDPLGLELLEHCIDDDHVAEAAKAGFPVQAKLGLGETMSFRTTSPYRGDDLASGKGMAKWPDEKTED